MKLLKKSFKTIFIFHVLLLPLQTLGYEFNPFDKSLPEEKELNELYRYPMLAIDDFLHGAEQYCNRLPSENEFKDFILNGGHKFIRCSKTIKASVPSRGTRDQIGKNLPYLPDFLKRNQYKVYSDNKNIFVILKQNSKEWKYKNFKSEDYEFIIHCTLGHGTCKLNKIKNRASSCRASKSFAKNCYFGDKKIIDY